GRGRGAPSRGGRRGAGDGQRLAGADLGGIGDVVGERDVADLHLVFAGDAAERFARLDQVRDRGGRGRRSGCARAGRSGGSGGGGRLRGRGLGGDGEDLADLQRGVGANVVGGGELLDG